MALTVITPINVGTAPNDTTGDPLRTGGILLNSNLSKLKDLTQVTEFGCLSIFKYDGNTDITQVEQKDVVETIITVATIKYFIKAQYNTGDPTIFGTEAGLFNDGSYNTIEFDELL